MTKNTKSKLQGFTLIGTVTEAQQGHAHIMTRGGETATKKSAWHPESAKGFTLIELLVVIAIIALLSGVILASLATARMKSRDARRIADFHQIMIALELYNDANGYYPPIHQAYATECATPPCWDTHGYDFSNNTGWSGLQTDLAPYIAKLPTDPVNTGTASDPINGGKCTPWQADCYVYAYGNVGRTGTNPVTLVATRPNTYDLITQLEDVNNPQSCKNSNTSYGTGIGPNAVKWCNGGENIDTIYDPSPN